MEIGREEEPIAITGMQTIIAWEWEDGILPLPLPGSSIVTRLAPSFPEPLDLGVLREKVSGDIRKLAERIRDARQIAILVEDASRPTETGPLVETLWDEIGILRGPSAPATLVMAAGAHGHDFTDADGIGKIGPEPKNLVLHDATAMTELVRVGTSRAGIPFWVNRQVAAADLRLSIGTVNIHPMAGFSGGAKILLPGVAGLPTIEALHALPAGTPGTIECGMRQMMQELEALVPLDFSWQLLSRADGAIYGYYSGSSQAAHSRAIAALLPRVTVTPPGEPADLVLAGCRPFHRNLLGTFKALAQLRWLPAPLRLVLFNEALEGRGAHSWRNQPRIVAAQRAEIARLYQGIQVFLYSPRTAATDFGELFPAEFTLLKTLPELLGVLDDSAASAKITVVPYAPVTLFRCRSKA